MKSTLTLLAVCPILAFVLAGQAPPRPAAALQTGGSRTDVYHVHFTKAALGKATALADSLKKPDPKAPMPGHFLVLRHQAGDSWDYVVIEHLGTQASLTAAGNPPAPGVRDLSEWHNDTFVNGPPWAQFVSQMGIGDAAAKTGEAVYVVSLYRAAPGFRDQLESLLSGPSDEPSAGTVLLQHLEGGPWNFLSIDRHNSWQDYAAGEAKSRPNLAKGQGDWFKIRDYLAFHTDTITDRIAP